MAETLLHRLLNVSPDVVLVVDPRTTITAANNVAAGLLEHSESSLRGRSLLEFVEGDRDAVLSFLRRCSGSGSALPGSLTLRTRSGRRAVTAHGAAVHVDGKVQIALHCTEAHRRSRAFRELEARLQALHHELHRERHLQIELQKALRERDTLLTEVHHRVRNNLQVISSFLSLQRHEHRSEQVDAVLRGTHARIQALALVHNQLYSQDGLDRIDLALLLPRICTELAILYEVGTRVRFVTSVAPWPLDVSWASPLALLVTEAVTNALKHAFPGGRPGTVTLELPTAGQPRQLRVADDGVGMAEAGGPGKEAVGSRLMRALAEQLGARLEINAEHGVEILLELPEEAASAAA